MISLLVPVYNYDVTSLINCLHAAIEDSQIFTEIIIGADGCDPVYTDQIKSLGKLPKVKNYISKDNLGRAAIRNRLADQSSGSHLLYIDADALISGNAKQYFEKWANHINAAPVICGGTAYRDKPPADPDKYLRWHYGYFREQRTLKQRNRNPYASFTGFNFMIEKELMAKIRFNEELKKYGHEDTLLGYQLKKAGIKFLHIDNPLIHDGIESNREFIRKTREGVYNLNTLYDMVTDKKEFAGTVRLLKMFRKLKVIGIARLLALLYKKRKRRIEIIVRSGTCSLYLFSLYKLSLFSYFRYGYDEEVKSD